MSALLEIDRLRVRFGDQTALDGVSLTLAPGARLGLVGESGSGKSTLGLAAMGLLPHTARLEGALRFRGAALPVDDDRAMQRLRGRAIGFIHQDPISAFSPVHSIGAHLIGAIRLARPDCSRKDARRRAIALLEEVGIDRAEERLSHYPHEYSGGMRQRVMIAAALAGDPALIIADEPTTALDVTTQSAVLAMMRRVVEAHGAGLILITHDLGVVAEICEDVAVMYGGRLVQQVAMDRLPGDAHPYTRALLEARPGFGNRGRRLPVLEDLLPPGWFRHA